MRKMELGVVLKSALIALSLTMSCLPSQAAPPESQTKEYRLLRILSGQNLNVSTGLSEDSLFVLARRAEAMAREEHNTAYEFKAGQIQVNTYGLQGKFGLAVNKAQQLLDKAHDGQNPLAMGIAIQAIGDNYMHSARYAQADSVFAEAAPYIDKYGDSFMQIQLMLQRLHVYFSLRDTAQIKRQINAAAEFLKTNNETPDGVEQYRFQLKFYEAFYAILIRDDVRVQQLLMQIETEMPAHGLWSLWYHMLAAQYYILKGDTEAGLAHSDLMLQYAEKDHNKNILRQALLQRSTVLESIGRDEQACQLYQEMLHLMDSLYQTSYTTQIDSLHVSYWIDHLQMANLTRRNNLFTKVAAGLFLVVLITALVVLLIRRKNRQLKASRLRLEAMREASADSIRSKSLFLSNMSHELRTPLNAITGFSDILTQDEEVDAESRQEYSGYIRQNADLLMKLINDVVDFSGLKGESIRFTFETCDVVALCRNVLHTVGNIKRTQAELEFVTTLDRLDIRTDKHRLQQVLINLLVNATKFTKEGRITLRLEVDAQRDQAIFMVEDTGCGIPLEKQPRIFERFEKLHEGVQGAGLGLSICKLIVEYTEGRIWIDPEYTQGTRFVFTHPLHFTPKESDA